MKLQLFAIGLLLIIGCSAIAQGPITVPGTHISMTPPSGWTASDIYSGFQDKNSGTVIVVTEMAGAPYSKTSAGLTKEQMAKRGMELTGKTAAVFGKHNGILLSARQLQGDETYTKWMACFGDESQSALIVATVKEALQEEVQNAVITSLMTARIETGATDDLLAGMLFKIQAKEPYKLAKRISSTLLFTHKGECPTPSPTAPMFIAASSLGRPPISDLETYAKERVQKTASVTSVNVYQTQNMTLDGLTGIQLMATAIDTETKIPMFIYQVMLFDKDVYYIIQGIAEQKAQSEAQLWFDMVSSFRHKTSSSAKP